MTWTGRQGALQYAELYDFLYESRVENIKFAKPSPGNITTRKLLPYGTCKVYEGPAPDFMLIYLKTANNESSTDYFVQISDPTVINLFQFPDSFLTGDRITIKADNVKKFVDYNVRFKEVRVETNDGSCTDYPTSRYSNYSDCIDTAIREEMLPVLGCMVPWISNKDLCKQPLVRRPEKTALAAWLKKNIIKKSHGGIHFKHQLCPLPCSVLTARATFRQSASGLVYQQHNRLNLFFEDYIDV